MLRKFGDSLTNSWKTLILYKDFMTRSGRH